MLSWGHIWAIVGGLFGVGAFFYKLTDKKFDKIDQKFDKIDQKLDSFQKETYVKFNSLDSRMTALEVELRGVNQRLSNVESCVMPRKVYHIEEPPKDEAKEN